MAKLANASQHIDRLARIAEAAGATDSQHDTATDTLICVGVSQEALDAALASLPAGTPTVEQIYAEANRRKRELVDATSDAEYTSRVIYGMQEATELLELRLSRAWTTAETARAAQLKGLQEIITLIDLSAVSLAMSLSADYADDKYWP